MGNRYYYVDNTGKQCGPVDESQLASCGVTGTTLIWCKGMKNWQPAGMVLGGNIGAPMQNPVSPPPPQPQYQQPPYQQPQQRDYYPQSNNNGAGNYNSPRINNEDPGFSFPPDNYMVWAILTTLLCNIICGIIAIVYSSKVNKYWAMGNKMAAYDAQKKTKTWCIASVVIGIVFAFFYIFIIALSS